MAIGAFPCSKLRNLDPAAPDYNYQVEAAVRGILFGLGQRLLLVRGPGHSVNLVLSASATAGPPTVFLSVPARRTLERVGRKLLALWLLAAFMKHFPALPPKMCDT